ncbi:DMT family transporter [Rhizobium sp. CFBP 8762]|uniref:DMT family transporter n=1 Tax=Rhizobium sp. CFBP 8762 TaxID=2775279 RepID=UPI001782A07D|nr:DMT family transporter [Rhizobium sp. CFBP 8762]MBD8555842.1 DMT family transporter [Rhizobium sp. CFBP 8762]
MQLGHNAKGALFMMSAMAAFAVNDAAVKAMTASLNVGQIMFVRGIFTTLLLFVVAWRLGALRPVRAVASTALTLRIFGEVCAAITNIYVLKHMQLANASAILQALPLAVTLGAALFLAEPVGWRRWLAIAVGFAGVLIIARPGPEGFTMVSLAAIATVLFAALRDLATKRVDPALPSMFVTVLTSAAITAAGGALMIPMGGWQPMHGDVILLICISGLVVSLGYHCIIVAMRTGEISFIAPFRYTGLVWSITLGVVFFGEVPDGYMLLGLTIVVCSGLYAFYRENKRRVDPVAQESIPQTSR